MQVLKNTSLKPFNTFGIDVAAEYFLDVTGVNAITEALDFFSSKRIGTRPSLILGGGSNILLTKNISGYVIKNSIDGLEKIQEDADCVYLRAGAGMNWHSFVMHCLDLGYGGLENLALIPGNVGASPMQNIGAYGVELRDSFYSLEAYHLADGVVTEFTKDDCEFDYRESVFKNRFKDQFVITFVTFRLRKKPVLSISYGAITEELERMHVQEPDIRSVALAVMSIRRSKLPDPAVIGNAGSFFKNPTLGSPEYLRLKERFPALVGYPLPDGTVKLASGWLIEQCGWKGYREGNAGCHQQQALVLVNYGNAEGKDVLHLADQIIASVLAKFNVRLETEVNVY